jgi:hypothetical protein
VTRPVLEASLTRTLPLVTALLLALGTAALVAPVGAGAAATACVPGKTTVAGKSALRFCGTAKATAKVGTRTFRFSGGTCATSGAYFTVNIGTLLIHRVAGAKPGPSAYFGVTITPPTTGTHLKQSLTWTSGGKAYSVLGNQVTLAAGRTHGRFSGRSLGGQKVTGTFSC